MEEIPGRRYPSLPSCTCRTKGVVLLLAWLMGESRKGIGSCLYIHRGQVLQSDCGGTVPTFAPVP